MKKNFLFLIFALLPMVASADTVEIDGIYYNLVNKVKQAEVTSNPNKYSGEVVIPSSVTYNDVEYSVTSIGEYAFNSCSSLTSITIPNSVTSIGDGAFRDCTGLTSVTIPNGVTSIGSEAFLGCSSLTSVTIPNSVTSIGNSAFRCCSSLTSITIPNSVTSIGGDAFAYCSSLTSVTIPNSVTSIGGYAFDHCSSLTSITIPNGVTTIGDYAFSYCSSLTSITIGSGVKNIYSFAFGYCPELTDVYCYAVNVPQTFTDAFDGSMIEYATLHVLDESLQAYKETEPWSMFGTIVGLSEPVNIDGIYYKLISKNGGNFAEVTSNPNKYTGEIVIPEVVSFGGVEYQVTKILDSAFQHCSSLTSITIPNSVTSIDRSAFRGCIGLISITIPNSVTSIGNYAFAECHNLTSITIPNSVTNMGYDAFRWCSSLTSVIVESGNTVYDSRENCNAIIETSSNMLISGCKNTIIPNSVTSIGVCAFENCTSLASITIPNSVISIGSLAFYGCTSLTSITIPNSVTRIDDRAFAGCKKLTSVSIGNSVMIIGDSVFSCCSSLSSINIPNSVEIINPGAFRYCSSLNSITIGSGINYIGYIAFAYCPNLTDVYCYAENIPNTQNDAFDDAYPEYATLHVPDKSLQAYKNTAPWSMFGTIVGISGGTPETPKCATPTISYENNKLTFSTETEDVEFVYEITDEDVKKGYTSEVELSVTYRICVYATKTGYDNSDVATATLCWIDKEGVFTPDETTSAVALAAMPVLIQNNGGMLTVQGAQDGTPVSVYTIAGTEAGSAVSQNSCATISTSMQQGDIAIIKIGERSIKVVLK